MQQHYQVISLHNIIRTQEAKLQELKEQLRLAHLREETRYGQIIENSQVTAQDRERVIRELRHEIEAKEQQHKAQLSELADQHDRVRDAAEREHLLAKKKVIELEGRIKRVEAEAQTQVEELLTRNRTMAEELHKYQQSKISKLNYFYKNSLFDISKRKETLLWVDKFTEYLENYESKEKRTLEDISNFVKNQINSLKTSLGEMVGEVVKNEKELQEMKSTTEAELARLIGKVSEECAGVLVENEEFWNGLLKQERNCSKNEEIKVLNNEINKLTQKHELEVQELKAQIRTYEGEKKTLILGFQQLRSLTEAREASYREEIKLLKHKIEELIETGSQRDKQFEEELKLMTGQIESITQRYYDNIQSPFKRVNERISEDVQQVKQELSRVLSDSGLRADIDNLAMMLTQYSIQDLRASHQTTEHLTGGVDELIAAVRALAQLLGRDDRIVQSQLIAQRQDMSGYGNKDMGQVLQEQQKQIDLRQKLNKSQYEISLTKKHLNKLKQYCDSLEKKLAPAPRTSSPWSHRKVPEPRSDKQSTLQRVLQLECENEALKEAINQLKQAHSNEIKGLLKKVQLSVKKEQNNQGASNPKQQALALLQQIQQIIQALNSNLASQHQQRQLIQQHTLHLQSLLSKPIKLFQLLLKQLQQLKTTTANTTQLNSSIYANTDRIGTSRNKSACSFFSADDVRVYKDNVLRRTDNGQQIAKVMNDLIKTIRESGARDGRRDSRDDTARERKRDEGRHRGVEKRIKDIQAQRVKEKQEMLGKIEKLVQNMDKISQKMAKSATLKSTLAKFEGSIDTKIDEIISKTQIKLQKADLTQIKDEVIGDLRSKLQEANAESEGLRKQMSLLFTEKKL